MFWADDTALTPGCITAPILGPEVQILAFSFEECWIMAEIAQYQQSNLVAQLAAQGNFQTIYPVL